MKMKQLKTRHALLVSCVSLLTSFAMLLSCTYAWFTDTATSGANRIEAGKFRVEAYHQTWQGTKPTAAVVESDKIEGKTNLFKSALNNNGRSGTGNNGTEYKLWEPGAMAVETFTIKNEGELALKYQFNLVAAALNQVTWSGVSGTYDLRDVIKVAIVSDATEMAGMNSRTDFESLSSDKWKSWTDFVSGATKTGNLLPNKSESFIVAMWWPSTANDNYYNLYARDLGTPNFTYYNCYTSDRLIIDVKTVVTATQDTVEADSFGTDYDQGAEFTQTYSAVNIGSNYNGTSASTGLNPEETLQVRNAKGNTGYGTLYGASAEAIVDALVTQATGSGGDGIKTGTDQDTVVYIKVDTTDQTTTSVDLDISLYAIMSYTKENGDAATVRMDNLNTPLEQADKVVTVVLELPAYLTQVAVSHSGSPMSALSSADEDNVGFYYNPATGLLTVKSKSFSPFQVTWGSSLPKAYLSTEMAQNETFNPMNISSYLGEGDEVSFPETKITKKYTFKAFENEADRQAVADFLTYMKITDDRQLSGITEEQIVSGLENYDVSTDTKEKLSQIINTRKDYLSYKVDFVISTKNNATIAKNTIALWGAYGSYSDGVVLGFGFPRNIDGNGIRLMNTMYQVTGNKVFNMDYWAICSWVQEFTCGASNLSEVNLGKTINVSLYMYPVDEDGDEITDAEPIFICGEDYTFTTVDVVTT